MQKMTAQQADALMEEYQQTRDIEVRNRLLEHYLYIADIVAKKFVGRGVPFEDLKQVAAMALVKALERYDSSREIRFTSFATPSLVGEVKNFFRDKTRMVHISRRDSEQLVKLQEARTICQNRGDNSPQALAEEMGLPVDRVLELLEIRQNSSVASLDQAVGEDDTPMGHYLGTTDEGFEKVENREFLKEALAALDEQERKLIHLRFWKGSSQREVAAQLGISQMSVSRMEKRILEKMRGYAAE